MDKMGCSLRLVISSQLLLILVGYSHEWNIRVCAVGLLCEKALLFDRFSGRADRHGLGSLMTVVLVFRSEK